MALDELTLSMVFFRYRTDTARKQGKEQKAMDKDKSEMAEALERIISIVKDPQSIDFLKIQAIAEHALTTAKAMPCHCGATGHLACSHHLYPFACDHYSIICPECGMITKEG